MGVGKRQQAIRAMRGQTCSPGLANRHDYGAWENVSTWLASRLL